MIGIDPLADINNVAETFATQPEWWAIAAGVAATLIFVARMICAFARNSRADKAFRTQGVITVAVVAWGGYVAFSAPNPVVWMVCYTAGYVLLRVVVHKLVATVYASAG
jgi:hypothetical protein